MFDSILMGLLICFSHIILGMEEVKVLPHERSTNAILAEMIIEKALWKLRVGDREEMVKGYDYELFKGLKVFEYLYKNEEGDRSEILSGMNTLIERFGLEHNRSDAEALLKRLCEGVNEIDDLDSNNRSHVFDNDSHLGANAGPQAFLVSDIQNEERVEAEVVPATGWNKKLAAGIVAATILPLSGLGYALHQSQRAPVSLTCPVVVKSGQVERVSRYCKSVSDMPKKSFISETYHFSDTHPMVNLVRNLGSHSIELPYTMSVAVAPFSTVTPAQVMSFFSSLDIPVLEWWENAGNSNSETIVKKAGTIERDIREIGVIIEKLCELRESKMQQGWFASIRGFFGGNKDAKNRSEKIEGLQKQLTLCLKCTPDKSAEIVTKIIEAEVPLFDYLQMNIASALRNNAQLVIRNMNHSRGLIEESSILVSSPSVIVEPRVSVVMRALFEGLANQCRDKALSVQSMDGSLDDTFPHGGFILGEQNRLMLYTRDSLLLPAEEESIIESLLIQLEEIHGKPAAIEGQIAVDQRKIFIHDIVISEGERHQDVELAKEDLSHGRFHAKLVEKRVDSGSVQTSNPSINEESVIENTLEPAAEENTSLVRDVAPASHSICVEKFYVNEQGVGEKVKECESEKIEEEFKAKREENQEENTFLKDLTNFAAQAVLIGIGSYFNQPDIMAKGAFYKGVAWTFSPWNIFKNNQ